MYVLGEAGIEWVAVVAVIAGIVALGGLIVWHIKIQSGVSRIQQQLEDFPLQKIDSRIKDIELELVQRQAPKFIKFASPMQLTDEGKKLVEDSGIKEFVCANSTGLTRIRGDFRHELYVFEAAQKKADVVFADMTNQSPEVLRIREYFYDQGINENVMKHLFALYLRDRYMQEYSLERGDRENE